jgi:CPA2 family monovalent cation:H+ antiporter-2
MVSFGKGNGVHGILLQMTIYLAAAVIAVPLSRWLGFGSVLGYLAAGVTIGPALHLVGRETENVQEFAEYGVVLMLFLIGLEMRPRVLWDMRHRLLGLGGLQVAATIGVVAAGCVLLLGLRWNAALAIGMILSMSSTAIVLQSLTERRLTGSEGGRASLAVLLFQDVAALPLIALMPLLAFGPPLPAADPHGVEALGDVPPWQRAALVAAAVGLVVLIGRYLTRPVYRFLRLARLAEIEIAGALLLVVGISLLMSLLGLSPALGSFLAGVVLANSEYRHQLEADLAPFKGLLLGLFFLTVGAGMDLGRLAEAPFRLVGLTLLLMALKMAVLWPLAILFRLPPRSRLLFTTALAQGGEFGFVLAAFAAASRVITPGQEATVLIVIALSMMLTPLLSGVQTFLDRRWFAGPSRAPDRIDEPGSVIIAGMGRFGSIVNRLLRGLGHRTVVLDSRPEVVERLRRLGIRGFYGDVDRPEVLEAAGLASARAVVVAVDDPVLALRLVRHVRSRYPDLPLIVRARDRHQVYELAAAGATSAVREVFPAAITAARGALAALGHGPSEIDAAVAAFERADQRMLAELAALWRPGVPAERNPDYLAKEREQAAEIEAALAGTTVPARAAGSAGPPLSGAA